MRVFVFGSHTVSGLMPGSSTAFCTAPKLMLSSIGTGFFAAAGRYISS